MILMEVSGTKVTVRVCHCVWVCVCMCFCVLVTTLAAIFYAENEAAEF